MQIVSWVSELYAAFSLGSYRFSDSRRSALSLWRNIWCDAAALDAALHMSLAQFGGQYLHPTVFHMAAAYGFHLCQNHPFFDGNKRTAGMAMLTFLVLNALEPIVPEMEYYETMMAVATGQMDKERLALWL